MNKMKKEKRTAVEWFFKWFNDNPEATHKEYAEAFEQAKAKESKNLKDSFVAGAGIGEMFNNENRCYVTDAEKYLKETFKSE